MNSIFLFSISGFIIGFGLAIVLCRRRIKTVHKRIEDSLSEKKIIDSTESETASKLEEKIWYEEEISFIFKLIEKLSLSLNRREIVELMVQGTQRFLNVEQCVLILLDKNTGKYKVEYAVGLKEDIIKNSHFKKGESISGWVMKNREPLIINNLDNEPWFKKINREDYLKGSFISVPLSIKDEILGVMNVCSKRTGEPFTREDSRFLINVTKVGAIDLQNVRLHNQMQEGYLKTITALAAAIDAKDSYTKTHSENVTRCSLAIAKELGCESDEIETIRRTGLLHDIGKIGIKDEILFKPGRLTTEEYEQIKLHPIKGETIIKSLSFLNEVSILIRHHHERYDGRGYPDGIRGKNIELGARILAVADSFDAMTSDRPYRKRLSLEETVEELKRNQGTQFDPQIIKCFLKILEQDPHIVNL